VSDENTPMPFCITCNKVITADNAMLHVGHNTGNKSFRQIYDDAVKNTQVRTDE